MKNLPFFLQTSMSPHLRVQFGHHSGTSFQLCIQVKFEKRIFVRAQRAVVRCVEDKALEYDGTG